MENKYKIILSYIQDLSVEITSPESLVTIRNTIPDYKMNVNINSKPLKRKMIEVTVTLTYENPNSKINKGVFQIIYATVIDILDPQIKKNELEKIILCDTPTKIYPELEKKFLTILREAGLPNLEFGNKINFEELFQSRLN